MVWPHSDQHLAPMVSIHQNCIRTMFAALLVAMILAGGSPVAWSATRGDMNGDGLADLTDALQLARFAEGLAVPTPGDVLMFDDFEDGNDNGWLRPTGAQGTYAVVTDGAGQVYQEQVATSDEAWTVGGNVLWTDQRLSVKVKWISSADAGNSLVLLAVRLTSMDAFYFIELREDGRVRMRLENGSTTELGEYDSNTPFTMLKMAVVPPIPRASVTRVTDVKLRFLASVRTA